ncbi:hypothetical protein GCM10027055_07910 [Janibacter alkaliphilus]|uniref:Putative membrane protein n=1 Tax=Janibacter alkaliphilus TaxID=1069963 RepID=A0A852XCC6_9MICO|nr:DUF6458 family protein [Janibacter alkaliphilus]NYG36141.1 putative membrane protein [Janibacter alkaliphilus]
MYIGVGIFLLLVGLVLVFAYTGDQVIAGIDLTAIGWIAILLGLVAIGLSLFMDRRRRSSNTYSSGNGYNNGYNNQGYVDRDRY